MNKGLYLLTYLNEAGEEDILEVPAYSSKQARIVSGIDEEEILSVEETVRKGAAIN